MNYKKFADQWYKNTEGMSKEDKDNFLKWIEAQNKIVARGKNGLQTSA